MDAATLTGERELLSLPLEVLSMTWLYLDNKFLKSTRLTCMYLEQLSTPLLFECFTIFPHLRSLQRFVAAATCVRIAKHIHKLEYDARWVRTTKDLVRDVARNLKERIDAGSDIPKAREAMRTASIIHSQMIEAGSSTDDLAQVGYLSKAFACLPNLKVIHLLDARKVFGSVLRAGPLSMYYHGVVELPPFYAQFLREVDLDPRRTLDNEQYQQDFPPSTYARAMFAALISLPNPLQQLRVTELDWDLLLLDGNYQKFSIFLSDVLARLKLLELKPQYSQDLSGLASENLSVILQAAVNLERLSLCLGDCSDPAELYGLNSRKTVDKSVSMFDTSTIGIKLPARLTWGSRLSHLELEELKCRSKEMKSVLKHCGKTLRSLTIDSIVLLPEEQLGKRACFVDLFRWMQKHLGLTEISLQGLFSNGGMQGWQVGLCYIPRHRQADCQPNHVSLHDRVHEFILRGGSCPLDHVAIAAGHYDLHKESYTAKTPAELMGPEYAGDDSWTMDYHDFRHDHDEDSTFETTEDEFDDDD
ncbi:hypothetical protein PMZ80_009268 [Knufia obscura]|uniref:Uncharacterized protein n=2 Tax=Knufia TaxID=430999 RepID=A0AAN8EKQ9_9EURO|nr:hypothetical protein PMZ80_009268 [Knufia obscura]KAK5948991.1 hypothetical protein OHC33_009912 [Knufia fluminis]